MVSHPILLNISLIVAHLCAQIIDAKLYLSSPLPPL